MALSTAIREATTRKANRRQQLLAEIRVDEQLLIEQYDDIFGQWDAADRLGDLNIEGAFQRLYGHLKSENDLEAMGLLTDIYTQWQRDERAEERTLFDAKDHQDRHLAVHRANTSTFLSDGCGPEGRAA